jgi:hypothetical protein
MSEGQERTSIECHVHVVGAFMKIKLFKTNVALKYRTQTHTKTE